jgi:DNA repair exonuclease SbcCD nuclease subunit
MALDFIIVNDLHLADKPPLGRKEGYRDEGLAMLQEVVDLSKEHDAVLIFTGDIFHIKRGAYVSDWLKREIIRILKQLTTEDTPWLTPLILPGNHDLGPQGLASLPSQPLGVILESGAADLLSEEVTPVVSGWRVVGRPYNMAQDTRPEYYALPEARRTAHGTPAPVIVVAHGSIIPPGMQRPYPTVTCTDIDMTGINLLVSGHIHEDLGVYPMKDDGALKIFANLGSLGRCSRTEANMTRIVKVLGVRLQGQEIQLHELPIKTALPAADIFVEHVVSDVDSEAISEVVAEMAHTELGLESEDFSTTIMKLGLSKELEQMALKYLEDAHAES